MREADQDVARAVTCVEGRGVWIYLSHTWHVNIKTVDLRYNTQGT